MILLIRHALVDACGSYLAGRLPGVTLNAEGRRQAAALADVMADSPLAAIYSSPLERARETAIAIARRQSLTIEVADELNEIDFGDWTGLSFEELGHRREWLVFNRARSTTVIPRGERMVDVQTRACRLLTRLSKRYGRETFALVSHADVLRALIAKLLGLSLDRLDAFSLEPASLSVVVPRDGGFELTCLNCHAYRRHCWTTIDRAS